MRDKTNIDAIGVLPPQDIDIERIVLGTILVSKIAQIQAADLLTDGTFYLESHRDVFRGVLALIKKNSNVDIMTVMDQMRKLGTLQSAGGPGFLSELTNRVGSEAHFEQHCLILKEHQIKREQIQFGSDLVKKAYDPMIDAFDINEFMSDQVHAIQNIGELKKIESNQELIEQLVQDIEEAAQKGGITGVPSGFREQDILFGGWKAPDFRVVAARPGMGKTALILCEAYNAVVNHGKTVMIFSLEMSALQLIKRLASLGTQIDASKFSSGKMEPEDWKQFHERISPLLTDKLIIVDDCGTVQEVRNRAKRERIRRPIDKIYVDYLQIMEGKGQTREQEISHMSRQLKLLCKEIDVPITALSQLSRKVDDRGDKRPKLSDLRESGAIEQDADIVEFVYRPQYYDEGQPGVAYLIVAKHRNGSLKDIKLRYVHRRTQFMDWTEEEIEF